MTCRALAFFLTALSATAQTPDLSGTWKMDAARSESAHEAKTLGAVTLLIAQTGNQITIETKTAAKDRTVIANDRLVYTLDNTETTSPGSSGTPVQCKAHWEGQSLVAETSRILSGSTVTTRWVMKLEGNELTVQKALTVQHGYQDPSANNVGKATDVFVRAPR